MPVKCQFSSVTAPILVSLLATKPFITDTTSGFNLVQFSRGIYLANTGEPLSSFGPFSKILIHMSAISLLIDGATYFFHWFQIKVPNEQKIAISTRENC